LSAPFRGPGARTLPAAGPRGSADPLDIALSAAVPTPAVASPSASKASAERSGQQTEAGALAPGLLRLAAEVARLEGELEQLQHDLAPLAAAGGLDPAQMRDFQALDRITQSLTDLATFAGTLARHAPEATALPEETLAAGLKLEEMRRRLAHGAPAPDSAESSEDIDWL